MLLADDALRVIHVSTHVSLRQACDRVTKSRVLDVIELLNKACVQFGIARPRLAVAGLNPHDRRKAPCLAMKGTLVPG